MKTLDADVKAALAAQYARPRMLAVFHLSYGDVFVSDTQAAPAGGPEFEPLVVSWGELSAPCSGPFTLKLPRTSIRLANTGDTPFSAWIEACIPEEIEVEIYLWAEGLEYDSRVPLGRFVISSPVRYDADYVDLSLNCSVVKRNHTVGRVIGRDEFPGADPDAVGETANIIYGSVEGVACHAVAAGGATSLSSDISATQTTGIGLSLASGETALPSSGTLQVGREKISYTGISGKTLTGVTRGVSGSPAAAHKAGETAFEVRQSYEYLVADHPVKSIGDVYVGGVRAVSGVTKLTNDSGMAKLVFSNKFTLEKSVGLEVDEGSHEHSGSIWTGNGSRTSSTRWTASVNPGWSTGEHVGRAFLDSAGNYFYIKANGQNYLDLASIHGRTAAAGTYQGAILKIQVEPLYQDTISAYLNAPATGTGTELCDKNWNSYCTIQTTSGYIKTTRSAPVSDKGIIVGAKLCGTYGNTVSATGVGARSEFEGGPFNGQYISGGGPSVATVRTADTLTKGSTCTWADFSGSVLKATYTESMNAGAYWEHWVEVSYIPYSGGASPATGVALKGDSAADFVVGGAVTCDVYGYADDQYGSFTGTPGTLITNPADVLRHFMQTYLGFPAEEFDASFVTARSALDGMVPGGYSLAGVIDSSVDGFDTVEELSSQSRLAVSHDGFTASAAVIGVEPYMPVKELTASALKAGSLVVTRTGREEVINSLTIKYKRDLGKGRADFLEVAASSDTYPATGDPDSIALYGLRGPARPFMFEFVRDANTANDLRNFFITRYKDASRRLTFTMLLDNIDVEPGDIIGLNSGPGWTSLTGTLFEVESVSLRLGSATSDRPDGITVRAREVG